MIAPDHFGFGRSDKPVDDGWYTIARHRAALATLIAALDLHDIHLVVQDWGGPIGLCTAVADPARYARLFILNTWLHEDGLALGGDMPTGAIVAGTMRRPGHDSAAIAAAARRFPFCIPFAEPELGDAAAQASARATLRSWDSTPVHLAFGDAAEVFPWTWAERWAAEIPGASLDRIEGAGHFVQTDAPDDCLAIIRARLDGCPASRR